MKAAAHAPMMSCCQSLYLGGAIINSSSSLDASVTETRSCRTLK